MYYLMKSEPSCYSIDDLKRERVGQWDGVRNYQARNFMRAMEKGDQILFYHSNAGPETGVVGLMKVVKTAYPDPTQFDPKSEHPDPKSDPANPRWSLVDVQFVTKFPRLVSLNELKLDPTFAEMALLRQGNRLSVMPVNKKHFDKIVKLGSK